MLKKLLSLALIASTLSCIHHRPVLSTESIASRAVQSNVVIMKVCDDKPVSGGSGVVLYQDSETNKITVLTDAHVIDDDELCPGKKIMLWQEPLSKHRTTTQELVLIKSDSDEDIALLTSKEPVDKYYPDVILANDDPNIGEDLILVGNPLLYDYAVDTVTTGIVSKREVHQRRGSPRMATSGAIIYGMSGGAIYNRRGELVGLCEGVLILDINLDKKHTVPVPLTSFNIAVRVSSITKFLKDL